MDSKTARTLNIRKAVDDAGGPSAFASSVGSGRWSQGQVSQWISEANPKPIGDKLARRLESALRMPAGAFDNWQDLLHQHDLRSPDLVTNQLENDIDAIRYALAGFTAVLASERPAEGARVAAAIRKSVPANFVVRGFLQTLLATLDRGAAQVSAAARRGERAHAKSE